MTEKKPKLIDLKGANSTMKLGLVLYAAIVVALIVGAVIGYVVIRRRKALAQNKPEV